MFESAQVQKEEGEWRKQAGAVKLLMEFLSKRSSQLMTAGGSKGLCAQGWKQWEWKLERERDADVVTKEPKRAEAAVVCADCGAEWSLGRELNMGVSDYRASREKLLLGCICLNKGLQGNGNAAGLWSRDPKVQLKCCVGIKGFIFLPTYHACPTGIWDIAVSIYKRL